MPTKTKRKPAPSKRRTAPKKPETKARGRRASAPAKGVAPASPRYLPAEIEPRWQAKWEADGLYRAGIDPTRRKFYFLTPKEGGSRRTGSKERASKSARRLWKCAHSSAASTLPAPIPSPVL